MFVGGVLLVGVYKGRVLGRTVDFVDLGVTESRLSKPGLWYLGVGVWWRGLGLWCSGVGLGGVG